MWRVKDRLLAWYSTHVRELPWRATRDPYAILVSEVMLQQTQVGACRAALGRVARALADGGGARRGTDGAR